MVEAFEVEVAVGDVGGGEAWGEEEHQFHRVEGQKMPAIHTQAWTDLLAERKQRKREERKREV